VSVRGQWRDGRLGTEDKPTAPNRARKRTARSELAKGWSTLSPPPPVCGICGKGGYTDEPGASAGLKATEITTYNREKPFSDTTPL
jgi:hypothetical protein